MWLIVGLGNPGAKYDGTRHNIGFAAADLVAGGAEFKAWKNSLVLRAGDTIIAKPQTFMNLSGRAVQELLAFYKIPSDHLIVIHDDIDLKPGDIRTKTGGSSGGHNGIKSIDEAVGPGYFRVRIGVGHPRDSETPQMDVSDWVLTRGPDIDISKVPDIVREKQNNLY
ncbi:MAG: aminoacyl-tRNA hydrolase [Rickettsiales bacterium]|jgi:PTH1 family peptidyl-tRNA hydrolase|nr:aminoacyl-tRNA hydrolase [Rickettsiales bacterium]